MLRRTLMLSVLAFSALSLHAFAEDSGLPADPAFAEHRAQQLKQQLSLSDDQTAKIQDILKQSRSSIQEQRRSFQEKRKDQRDQIQNQISSVLNDEQKQKLQSFEQNRQNRNGRGGDWKERFKNRDENGKQDWNRGRHYGWRHQRNHDRDDR